MIWTEEICDGSRTYRCSRCGHIQSQPSAFCPNCGEKSDRTKIGRIEVVGKYVEDCGGGSFCLTAVTRIEEDGKPSVYFAAIAEELDMEFCIRRIPFGMICEADGLSPWDNIPESVTKAIREAGIEDELLSICRKGWFTVDEEEGSEANRYPWMDECYYKYETKDGWIPPDGRDYTGLFSYTDKGIRYVYGTAAPENEIMLIFSEQAADM